MRLYLCGYQLLTNSKLCCLFTAVQSMLSDHCCTHFGSKFCTQVSDTFICWLLFCAVRRCGHVLGEVVLCSFRF